MVVPCQKVLIFKASPFLLMKSLVATLWRVAAIVALTWVPVSHAELIHRYSFTANANDSVGTANGVARQTVTGGVPNGSPVLFNGTSAYLDGIGSYIDLPNGLVSGLTNLTIETWIDWDLAGGNWQRVFDFGISDNGEDTDGTKVLGNGQSYIFFAPAAGGVNGSPRFTIKPATGAETPVLNSPLTLGLHNHVVIVYTTNVARVFIDGQQVNIGLATVPLSAIDDRNVFLGRSQYGGDSLFQGAINEFRIFDHALTAQEIKASYTAGNPDTLNYAPGALTSLTLSATTSMLAGGAQTPTISGQFANLGAVDLFGPDVQLTSSAPAVVAVSATGSLKAIGAGSATITATLSGMTSSVTISVAANPPQLKNRYSFSEAQGATTLIDSVGAQNGTLHLGTNTPVQSGSALTVPPVNTIAAASYIDLPAGVISQRTNASIEVWFTWNDGPTSGLWTRLFDIGNSGKGTDANGSGGGLDSWWFSPQRDGNVYGMSVWNGTTAVDLFGPNIMPTGQKQHLVAIYAPNNLTSKIYLNGKLITSGTAPFALSTLNDANVWLGVSNWDDPPFNGVFDEFRIWEGELSDLDVALSEKAGPDALPVAPGTLQSVALNALPASFIGNLGGAQAEFIGNFQNVSGVVISGLSGVAYASTDTNVFAVTTTGAVNPRNIGAAKLIASYQGLSATTSVQVLAPLAIHQTGISTNLHSGSVTFTSALLADYTGTNNVAASAFAGVSRSSSDTNIVTISAVGLVTPRLPGSAVLTAVYSWVDGSVTNSKTENVTVTVVNPPGFTKGTLIHRYSFNEAAASATFADSVGTANGVVGNATGADFTGSGEFTLTGTTSTYGDLPNGIISSLTSVSIEGWVTWNGAAGSSWQRIFDFGRSTSVDANGTPVEDMPGTGYGYMFLTPRSGDNTTRFAIKQGTGAEIPQLNTAPMSVGVKTHFAVVYDTEHSVARLYINGARVATAPVSLPLTVIEDINVWLGRSQFNDSFFNGSYDEFRIYNGPLLDADVAASFAAGPNSLAVTAPSVAIGKVGSNIEITWPESAAGYVLQSASQVGGTYAPTAVTPTTNGGVVKATVPVATGATNVFFQLKK